MGGRVMMDRWILPFRGEGRARGVLHGGWAVHELSLPAYWVGTYTQAPALDSRWATGTEFRAVYRVRHTRAQALTLQRGSTAGR